MRLTLRLCGLVTACLFVVFVGLASAEDQSARELDRQLAVDALMRADKHAHSDDYAAAEIAFLHARIIDLQWEIVAKLDALRDAMVDMRAAIDKPGDAARQ